MLAPDGTARLVPDEQVDAALQAGGKRVVKMADPNGTPRWVPSELQQQALQAGGKLLDVVPQKGYLQSAADASGLSLAKYAVTHPGETFDAINDLPNPNGVIASAVKGELKRSVGQLKEAWDTPNNQPVKAIDRTLYAIPGIGGALKEADEQYAAGNVHGAYGTLTGLIGSMLVPEAVKGARTVGEAAAPTAAAIIENVKAAPEAAAAIIENVKTAPARALAGDSLDRVIPNDTVTRRQAYNAAKAQGVEPDMAQAAGSKRAVKWKKQTEFLDGGNPHYDDLRDANRNALNNHVAQMLDEVAPAMSREDAGNLVQAHLADRHAQLQQEHAGMMADATNELLDGTDYPQSRADFGNQAKANLLQHQAELNNQAGDIFENLTNSIGSRRPNAKGVRTLARKIVNDYEGSVASKTSRQAWNIVNDLAQGVGPGGKLKSPIKLDTWSDLHGLRSDLMSMYRSPEIVGTRAESWLEQLTGAVDKAMTDGGSGIGLSNAEYQAFRRANAIYKEMKVTYDDPKSALYHIVRSPDGLQSANMLAGAKPSVVDFIRKNVPSLEKPLQRQMMERLLSPAGNDIADYEKLGDRLGKANKEQLRSILDPEQINALNDLASAKHPELETFFENKQSPISAVVRARDGLEASDKLAALTPGSMQYIRERFPELERIIQRQKLERIFSPAGNTIPEWGTLTSRFNRSQKEMLRGILTPEQIQGLEDTARTSRVVNLDANPPGTAKVMLANDKRRSVWRNGLAGAGVGLVAAGPVGAVKGFAVGSAKSLAERGFEQIKSKTITSPEMVERVMAVKGPLRWRQVGAQKLAQAGVDQSVIDDLGSTAKGQRILERVSDFSQKSRAMQALLVQLGAKYGPPADKGQ